MITIDRKPVNKDAAMALSKGNDRPETVEEALKVLGERIASDDFSKFVRAAIESGANCKYELTIKKSNSPGFVVSLDHKLESPRKQLGTFLKLL